ncbi:MAG: rhodanese-like domain-containing protein [Brevinema sp.]
MKKFLLMTLLVSSCSTRSLLKTSYNIIYPKQITVQELDYMITTLTPNNYLIIDIRTRKNYQQQHINRSLSLSDKNLESITNIPNYQSKRLIFYDQKNVPFFKISKKLQKLQITNFYLLQNGFEAWQEYTNPIEE